MIQNRCTNILLLLILIILFIGVSLFIIVVAITAIKLPPLIEQLIEQFDNSINNATIRIDIANNNLIQLIEKINKLGI